MRRVLSTIAVTLAVMSASAPVHARGISGVPQPRVKPTLPVADAAISSALRSAQVFLERGEAENAYYAAIGVIDSGEATADLHVVAAKAALTRVKTATLLRKKRWAKRGRDHFQAALALDATHEDALFGLATFALRAPKGLGGGDEAFVELKQRLAAVSLGKTAWLQARAAAENEDMAAALERYFAAVSVLGDAQLIAEFANMSMGADIADVAYNQLSSLEMAELEPCVSYTLSGLALAAGAPKASQLSHLSSFLAGDQQFCSREFVALKAAEQAQEIAKALGRAGEQQDFAAMADDIRRKQSAKPTQPSIAS